jgi:plasmid maintenance system antidote protein VapI
LYQEVFDANRRLCERLGVDEDKDIEHLINNMQDITKILAMKMFDYGMQVQQEATVSDRRENE